MTKDIRRVTKKLFATDGTPLDVGTVFLRQMIPGSNSRVHVPKVGERIVSDQDIKERCEPVIDPNECEQFERDMRLSTDPGAKGGPFRSGDDFF